MPIEKQKNIVLFCIITAIFWFSLYTYTPFISDWSQNAKASLAFTGVIIGSYGFMQMIFRIPVGILSDKLNKRKIFIAAGMVVASVSALGLFIFRTPAGILIFRGMGGVAAATWVTYTVLFSGYYKEEDASHAIGIISSWCSIGQMLGMVVSSIFVWSLAKSGLEESASSVEGTFLLAVGAGLVGLVLVFFIPGEKKRLKEPLKIKELLLIGKNPKLLFVCFLAIIHQMVVFSTVFGFTPEKAKIIGADRFLLSLLAGVSTMPEIFMARFAGSFLLKKFPAKTVLCAGFVIQGLSYFAMLFCVSLPALFITQFLGGFGRGMTFPVLMTLSIKDVEQEKRATAMGFFQAIYGIGMFVGPVVSGLFSSWKGFDAGFLFNSFLALAGGGLALLYDTRSKGVHIK